MSHEDFKSFRILNETKEVYRVYEKYETKTIHLVPI